MKIGIFDLETSNFNADAGIILCGSMKEYGKDKIDTVRADSFPSWKTGKSNNRDVVETLYKIIKKYDIIVMHNGEFFDKGFFNAKCLEYGLDPIMRTKKTVDPCMISRRHMKMGRNSLHALIDYFDVEDKKTPMVLRDWVSASHDGNMRAMDRIVKHNRMDVVTLERVYDKIVPLIDVVNKKGSYF